MIKILVTGVNSYIGKSFENWVSQFPDKYSVDTVSVRDDLWKKKEFKGYDVIIHAAAIVHVKEQNTNKYFEVNRDLTLDLAKKAKNEGVKQFIFLSTMGVYGTETGVITESTSPSPKTPYAKSKYEAEKLLEEIKSNDFNIAILRPPIVYGKDCGGNYTRLSSVALKSPVFPNIKNRRSMIYIDNLSEFIRLLIENNASGLYFPQNKEYVETTSLVSLIAKAHNKQLMLTKALNWAVPIGLKSSGTFRKVFGSYVYDRGMAGGPGTIIKERKIDYETLTFKESILQSEKGLGDIGYGRQNK